MIHYASHAVESADNCGGWYNVGTNITAGFHTYGVDIEPSGITYYFDGNAYATASRTRKSISRSICSSIWPSEVMQAGRGSEWRERVAGGAQGGLCSGL